VRFYVARRSKVIVKGLTFHSLIENTVSQQKQVAALVVREALGRLRSLLHAARKWMKNIIADLVI
jgi:hypothetical protein